MCIVLSLSSDSLRTRWKTLLVGLFALNHFHHPLTTPWLSPYTVKCSPLLEMSHRARMRSSKAMASAHCMSHPWDFHPSTSRHARHLGLIVMATLNPELVSEYAWYSVGLQGSQMGLDRLAQESCCLHHRTLTSVSLGGECGMKALLWKRAVMFGLHLIRRYIGLHRFFLFPSPHRSPCTI